MRSEIKGMYKGVKKPGVSIIICCYNSAKVLPKTLEHIANQKVECYIPWEVIVVNNNSSDKTKEIANKVWHEIGQKTRFLIVDQPIPGLSFAREKGFEVASYEYMLLCDDDNWLRSDYVQLAYEIMERNSKIGILGGQGIPVFEGEKPKWFEKVKGLYATGPQAEISGDVSSTRKFVYGAGAVIRSSAYQYLKEKGFKSILSDRKGKELSSGGDSELCFAMLLANYLIWYDNRLVFSHFLTNERLTWDYLTKLNKGLTISAYYLRAYTFYIPFDNQHPKSMIWLRDLRYLLFFVPKLAIKFYQHPKKSLDKKLQFIELKNNFYLIKEYITKRSTLDKHIVNVKEFRNRLQ